MSRMIEAGTSMFCQGAYTIYRREETGPCAGIPFPSNPKRSGNPPPPRLRKCSNRKFPHNLSYDSELATFVLPPLRGDIRFTSGELKT